MLFQYWVYYILKGVRIMIVNDKDEKISSIYIGYIILDAIKNIKKDKFSMYEICDILRNKDISSGKQLVLKHMRVEFRRDLKSFLRAS